MSKSSGPVSGPSGAEKAPDAFRTISEVADELELPQHVLRFWETRFAQIKPLKRGGGRRYYRPPDVELLRGIRHLLYGEGYTIRGVQRILREQGLRFVVAAAQGGIESSVPDELSSGALRSDLPGDEDGAKAMAQRLAKGRPRPAETDAPLPTSRSTPAQLSGDQVKRLETMMSDLHEMKRILDAAR